MYLGALSREWLHVQNALTLTISHFSCHRRLALSECKPDTRFICEKESSYRGYLDLKYLRLNPRLSDFMATSSREIPLFCLSHFMGEGI